MNGNLDKEVSYDYSSGDFYLYWENDVVYLNKENIQKLIPILQEFIKHRDILKV